MARARILPPTSASLRELSKIQGDDRCVLTVYFPGARARGRKKPPAPAELPDALLPAEGLSRDEATAMIVRGFLKVEIEGLPPMLEAELKKAIEDSEEDLF